jgi:two-component system chemotaxis response regulator CheB
MVQLRSPDSGADAEPHTVVVIGASAGGVETLVRVVGGLPRDLAATVCIVLHISPGSPSALPSILQRASVLPCRSAVDGELLRDGEILVAPPDRHLVVSNGRVSLTVGPRENGHRPAVDVLFRTAAVAQDVRVIGVVLSGTRDDGTAGLAVIKSRGGMTIVQDPAEAIYPGMPASALAQVDVDAVVTSDQVAETIVRVVNGDLTPVGARIGNHGDGNPGGGKLGAGNPGAGGNPGGDNPGAGNPGAGDNPSRNASPSRDGNSDLGADLGRNSDLGGAPVHVGNPVAPEASAEPADPAALASEPVTSTCPECGGVLQEYRDAGVTQWRCRVGHRYSPESLADAQAEGVEGALWAAVRALDDRQAVLERIARQFRARGHDPSAHSFSVSARKAGHHANAIRVVLGEAASASLQKFSDSEAVQGERRGVI